MSHVSWNTCKVEEKTILLISGANTEVISTSTMFASQMALQGSREFRQGGLAVALGKVAWLKNSIAF